MTIQYERLQGEVSADDTVRCSRVDGRGGTGYGVVIKAAGAVIVAVLALAGCDPLPAPPVDAERPGWTVARLGAGSATASRVGEARRLGIGVFCTGTYDERVTVSLSMGGRNFFANGVTAVAWDDGEWEQQTFVERRRSLVLRDSSAVSEARSFVAKLQRHDELHLRVTEWPTNEPVTDTITLTGASSALSQLSCLVR